MHVLLQLPETPATKLHVLWAVANGRSQTSLTIENVPVILIGTFRRFEGLKLLKDSRKGYQKTYGAHGSEIRFPTTWRISEPSTVSAIWLRFKNFYFLIQSLKSRTGIGTPTWKMASQDSDTWFGISPYL